MTQIKIGDFILDSQKLPPKGLDYQNFGKYDKQFLSLFDKDAKKGHLSQKELGDLFAFFASRDGATELQPREYLGVKQEPLKVKHPKDGELDGYEQDKVYDDLNELSVQRGIKERIEEYQKEYRKMPDKETMEAIKNHAREEDGLHSFQVANAEFIMYRAMEAEKRGLEQTDIADNVYVDKFNKYYTCEREFWPNGVKFYQADSEGNYTVTEDIGEIGQKKRIKYDKDHQEISLKALKDANHVYTNPKYAAKVLGYECDDKGVLSYEAYTSNGTTYGYLWNEKQHAFVLTAIKKVDD